jgi:hypothetical protein
MAAAIIASLDSTDAETVIAVNGPSRKASWSGPMAARASRLARSQPSAVCGNSETTSRRKPLRARGAAIAISKRCALNRSLAGAEAAAKRDHQLERVRPLVALPVDH